MSDEFIQFPQWKPVLAECGLPLSTRRFYQKEIIGLLSACKSNQRGMSVCFMGWYLDEADRRDGRRDESRREALRWLLLLGPLAGARG